MSEEKPRTNSESHSEKPDHSPAASEPVSNEAVITTPSPEDLEKRGEILADLNEKAHRAETAEPQAAGHATEVAPVQTVPIPTVEKPKTKGHQHAAATKVSLGLFGGTGILLTFFAVLFANVREKLEKAMGIKFDSGGGGGHAKPAGGHGGGHH